LLQDITIKTILINKIGKVTNIDQYKSIVLKLYRSIKISITIIDNAQKNNTKESILIKFLFFLLIIQRIIKQNIPKINKNGITKYKNQLIPLFKYAIKNINNSVLNNQIIKDIYLFFKNIKNNTIPTYAVEAKTYNDHVIFPIINKSHNTVVNPNTIRNILNKLNKYFQFILGL